MVNTNNPFFAGMKVHNKKNQNPNKSNSTHLGTGEFNNITQRDFNDNADLMNAVFTAG